MSGGIQEMVTREEDEAIRKGIVDAAIHGLREDLAAAAAKARAALSNEEAGAAAPSDELLLKWWEIGRDTASDIAEAFSNRYPREAQEIVAAIDALTPPKIVRSIPTVNGTDEPPDAALLRYNDPLCTDPVIHRESVISKADAIKWMKHAFPERNYTDEDALDDFIVVNWAWDEPPNAIPAGVIPSDAGPDERTAALMDMEFVAGAQAGFRLGDQHDDAGLAKLIKSRSGYLGALKRTREAGGRVELVEREE